MKKTILSLFCVLALCLGLLPATALADDTWAPGTVLYVGDVQLSGDAVTGTEGYYIQNTGGAWEKYTGFGTPSAPYFHYNGSGTLKLHGVSLEGTAPHGTGIYLEAAPGQAAALTLWLEGSSTVSGTHGIFVKADAQNASLHIGGTGSLTAVGTGTGGASGITVQSGGQAQLSVSDASVTAENAAGQGVLLQSGESAPASLAVDHGSLTVSGASAGIQYWFGAGASGSGTPSLAVTRNAVVDAKNGGIASNSAAVQFGTGDQSPSSTGGIVWNGKNATVYGNVSMQQGMTIGQGETLTIPSDAQLNTNSYPLTVDGGTVNGQVSGKVVYKATGVTLDKATLSLKVGEDAKLQAILAPAETSDTAVSWQSSDGKVAKVDEFGTVTAVGPGAATITVTTRDGGFTADCDVTVTQPVTSVTLDQPALTLVEGSTGSLQPTVGPENADNKNLTWTSSAANIATVDNGVVTAVAPGTATITAAAADGSGRSASCTVTVEAKTYLLSADKATLDFGSVFTGNPVPGAQTVTLTNKGNQQITVSLPASTYYNITAGNGFAGNQATLAPGGTASFTAQPKTGLAAGTWQETVTVSGDHGVQAALLCKLTVTDKTYSMSIDPGAIGFGNLQPGYDQPAVREVVVKNTGNQPLTLTQPTAVNYQVGSLNQFTVAPGDTAIFTVQPKAGLLPGTYNETVVVAAAGAQNVSVNLTFSVGSAASSGSAVTEKRTLHFETNGGLPLDDVVRGLGAPVELWPYTPVRAGYLFQGWYADQALTQSVGSVVLTKDTTVYAKWAVDPAAAAAAQSGSSSGKGSSGSGSSGKGSGSTTVTVTPSPTVTPTPAPTATPTPEPTATPEASAEPETDADAASFPVVPVAAGVIVLVVLVGGIIVFRRFRD